jgi:beta-glucuronidase
VVCVSRYYGWYLQCGQLATAAETLAADLDETHAAYGKPIILSEFGADAVAGLHSDPPEMFTEEYQAALIEAYLQVCAARLRIVGTHLWNFADFKTQQAVHRVVQNRKGIFTCAGSGGPDRRPGPSIAPGRQEARWSSRLATRTGLTWRGPG